MDVNYCYTLKDLKIKLEIESLDLSPIREESLADQSLIGIVVDEQPASIQQKDFDEVGPQETSKLELSQFIANSFDGNALRASNLLISRTNLKPSSENVTCLLFRESIEKIKRSFKSIKDPSKLMHAFIEIEELVGKQFKKYRALENSENADLRNKVRQHAAQTFKDRSKLYEDLDSHLTYF